MKYLFSFFILMFFSSAHADQAIDYAMIAERAEIIASAEDIIQSLDIDVSSLTNQVNALCIQTIEARELKKENPPEIDILTPLDLQSCKEDLLITLSKFAKINK